MARVKDIDGSREVVIEVQGDAVFLEGRGFCYEFDLGLFWHGMKKELARNMGVSTGAIPVLMIDGARGFGTNDGLGISETPELV